MSGLEPELFFIFIIAPAAVGLTLVVIWFFGLAVGRGIARGAKR